MNACFPDDLILRDAGMRGNSRLFRLGHYFRIVTSKGICTLPCGFLTDGASIPTILWGTGLQPFGPWFYAALGHDFWYSRASTGRFDLTRKEADDLFLEAMFNLGVPWHTRHMIHSAVRCAGWRNWKKR